MPGGAGGELTPFQQQHITPADLGQVIQHTGTDDAATDDDGSRGILHVGISPDRVATVTPRGDARPKGPPVVVSHARRCRTVLEGVRSSQPAGNAASVTGTCAMWVEAALPLANTSRC